MTKIVSPLSEDESSSKEEPSSTVEEIETKSFTEQSSDEIQREPDGGTKIHFINHRSAFSAFPQIVFCYKDCVYFCVCLFSRGYASQTSASTERFTKYGKG